MKKEDKLLELIRENRMLFWSVGESDLSKLSTNLVVETVLIYGDKNSVKKLFDILGIKQVAAIFYRQISKKRNNYPQRTAHYFSLYFRKNA